MNRDEKSIARMLFKNKVLQADGQAFEDLFVSIMNYSERDFQAIKAWGNIGDRKNDGYNRNTGTYYQVYAPEEITKSYANIIKKVQTDFQGLLSQWTRINEYYFVVNDKYKGVNADGENIIQTIKQQHNLTNAGFMTAKDLENLLFDLSDDIIETVIGKIPDPAAIPLDYSALEEVIVHVMKQPINQQGNARNKLPDWENKITFNDLDDIVSSYLNNGLQQISALDTYLRDQSASYAEDIKEHIREIYENGKIKYSGNELFWHIVNTLSPQKTTVFQAAAIVLMSKYFETCDIFQEPK